MCPKAASPLSGLSPVLIHVLVSACASASRLLVVPPRACEPLLSTSSLHQPCIHRCSREIGPTATRHGRCPLTNQLETTSSSRFYHGPALGACPAIPGLTLGPSVRGTRFGTRNTWSPICGRVYEYKHMPCVQGPVTMY
ncbi:hypothetical protein V8C42DRAFT_122060 [Trichoderma barbatum]